MESVERISTDVEEEQNRTAKVCALPGAQMRGTWGTQIQWLYSLLPAPGPPANVIKHPTSAWVVQQLREAFPYDAASKYLIFDRGTQFNEEVVDTMKSFGIQPKRTSFRSPWQNGVAERWVGNCRRDLLDHVIVLNEQHLKRLMNEYVRYYHDDRTHLALEKRTPAGREAEIRHDGCKVISMPRLGGLHHRYDLAA